MPEPTDENKIVDISQEAAAFEVFSDGALERLDSTNKVKFRWHKARVILWLSASTIATIILASLAVLVFSADETSRDWARQSLTALLGFSAGAIWTSSQKDSGSD